jgi:hypothetical protein
MEEVTVTKKEYDQLIKDQRLLNLLEAYGVDSWGGWDQAIEALVEEDMNEEE